MHLPPYERSLNFKFELFKCKTVFLRALWQTDRRTDGQNGMWTNWHPSIYQLSSIRYTNLHGSLYWTQYYSSRLRREGVKFTTNRFAILPSAKSLRDLEKYWKPLLSPKNSNWIVYHFSNIFLNFCTISPIGRKKGGNGWIVRPIAFYTNL